MTKCPIDNQIRYGRLDNGLTFYIRHNETPRGLGSFYLVKSFGSVVEDDGQCGYAHFLEHMSFEGSSHFPGGEMIKKLESIGVRFGEELNAYTSSDETVYSMNNVPISKENMELCLNVFSDWIFGLTLDDKAIETEKSIILEEFDASASPIRRMFKDIIPKILCGSKYALRPIIGKKEIIKNITREDLTKFYRKWSRTDLSAVILVGDFDVDYAEKQLKATLGNLTKGQVVSERPFYPVKDNIQPIITATYDSEQQFARLALWIKKKEHEDPETFEALRDDYIGELILRMLDQRLTYISNASDAPFVNPYVSYGDFVTSKTCKAYELWADMETDNFSRGLYVLYREILKAVKFGFTQSELKRAMKGWMNSFQTNYDNRNNRKSEEYAQEYVRHFTRKEPIISIEQEYDFVKSLLPNLTLDEVNEVTCRFYEGNNLVVSALLPKSSKITPNEISDILSSSLQDPIEPSTEDDVPSSLMDGFSEKGKIVSSTDFVMGHKKIILSNGATVYLRQTDFDDDEVLLYAFSMGGKSMFQPSEYRELFAAEQIPDMSGLGNFSRQDVCMIISDKSVEVTPIISTLSSVIKGSCSFRDFKIMMEMVHLIFSSPRFDMDSFTVWKQKILTEIKTEEASKMKMIFKMADQAVYLYPNFYTTISSEEIDKIDYKRSFELFRQVYSDPSTFSFVFTGKISERELIPYLEEYISTIKPTQYGANLNRTKDYHRTKPGKEYKLIEMELETPSSYSVTTLFAVVPLTPKNMLLTEMVSETLEMELLSKVRSQEGDVYSIFCYATQSCFAPSNSMIYIVFQTSVGKEKEIHSMIDDIIGSYVENGPKKDSLQKCREYLRKKFKKDLRTNAFIQNKLVGYLISSKDEIADYENILNSVTEEDLKDLMQTIVSSGNKKRVVVTAPSHRVFD